MSKVIANRRYTDATFYSGVPAARITDDRKAQVKERRKVGQRKTRKSSGVPA